MKDREIIGRMMGSRGYALHFNLCGHVMELPMAFVHQFENEDAMLTAIEKIECPICNQEFKWMEDTLNLEHRRLIENGGLKWWKRGKE